MFFPVSLDHVRNRSLSVSMGVSVGAPSSWSHCRRTKLSTIDTSCPCAERYSDVAHPQYPSPPKTINFIRFPWLRSPFRLSLLTDAIPYIVPPDVNPPSALKSHHYAVKCC